MRLGRHLRRIDLEGFVQDILQPGQDVVVAQGFCRDRAHARYSLPSLHLLSRPCITRWITMGTRPKERSCRDRKLLVVYRTRRAGPLVENIRISSDLQLARMTGRL